MKKPVVDLLNSDENAQESDTTGVDSSNKDHIINNKKYTHEK
jgi:hypothetical protein